MTELARHPGRGTLWIDPGGPLPGQLFQRRLRAQPGDQRLLWILVAEFVQAEAAALYDLQGPLERLGMAGEQARHLFGPLQVAVGVALTPEPHVVDGAALANAGDHVLKDAPIRGGEENVVGHDRSHPPRGSQVGELKQARRVARPPA